MTTIKMNYEGNVNDGLIKFVEGLKTSTYDKLYNSMCLNVVSYSDETVFQVDRVYGADLTKVDFESELYGMIYDEKFDECSLSGEFIFELTKYKANDVDIEHKKLEAYFDLIVEAGKGIQSVMEYLENKVKNKEGSK